MSDKRVSRRGGGHRDAPEHLQWGQDHTLDSIFGAAGGESGAENRWEEGLA